MSTKPILNFFKYVCINTCFTLLGFGLSFVLDFARWFKLDDAHDLGLTNLFFTTTIFTILGLIYTGYLFFEHKFFVILSVIAIIGLLYFIL